MQNNVQQVADMINAQKYKGVVATVDGPNVNVSIPEIEAYVWDVALGIQKLTREITQIDNGSEVGEIFINANDIDVHEPLETVVQMFS